MAIIVEDGTNVPNTNSYVSVADFKAHLAISDIIPSETDAQLEKFLLNAKEWLEVKKWIGKYVYVDGNGYKNQPLEWPRYDSKNINMGIHYKIKKAQLYLAKQSYLSVDLFPAITENAVFSEKIGPISTVYTNYDQVRGGPKFPYLEELLADLFRQSGFSTVRV